MNSNGFKTLTLCHAALCVLVLVGAAAASEMESVAIAPDNSGFVLQPSGNRFVPWGHNYASVDVLTRVAEDPERVEREFAMMKAMGTTVARVHPEMPRLLIGPQQVNGEGIALLERLLHIAERAGIYLQVTGLSCYQLKDRMAWYDSLDETQRWQTQAFCWESMAQVCSKSQAVFAYDLVNEPVALGKPGESWYTGRMGDVEFCQRLSLNAGERTPSTILCDWTTKMVQSIRKHDPQRLITIGMLPFPGAYREAAPLIDFVSPHLYPKAGKVDAELDCLKQFAWGKPIVIGETFPLQCSSNELQAFLLRSRDFSQGWLGHWPDTEPERLQQLKVSGQGTIADAIWLSWVELFQHLGPEMTSSSTSQEKSGVIQQTD